MRDRGDSTGEALSKEATASELCPTLCVKASCTYGNKAMASKRDAIR